MKTRYCALLAAAFALASIWPTWPPLVRVWTESADYHHGPLVALIALAWLIRSAAKVEDTAPAARELGLSSLLLGLALCAWLIAYKANVELAKQLLAPAIVWLSVATGAGRRTAAAVAGPLLYVYCAIPLWDLLLPLLQSMTVTAAHVALGLAGVPVRIDGDLVTIPEGSFIVLEGCSGKRYLIVTLAAAGLLSAVNPMSWRRRIGYLTLCTLLALIANWLRVIIVIFAGHITNMTSYLVAREHLSLGWLIFILLLAAVWALSLKFSHGVSTAAASQERAGDPRRANAPSGLVAAGLLLCLPILAISWAAHAHASASAQAAVEVPLPGPAWRGPLPASREWTPSFAGASSQSRAAFESDGGMRVETYWAAYLTQAPNTELVHYSNRLRGEGWMTLSTEASERSIHGRVTAVQTLLTETAGGSRWLIDYYYVVDGVSTTHDWTEQLLYGALSWGRAAPSGIVAAAVACHESCDGAKRALSAYWAASRS